MKIAEISKKHLNVYLNNEEAELLKKFEQQPVYAKRDLDDRLVMIANQLVNKDLVKRIKQDGKIVYKRTTR